MKNVANLVKPTINKGKRGSTEIFFEPQTWDLCPFCSSLNHNDAQYFNWKFSQIFNGIVSTKEHSKTFNPYYLHLYSTPIHIMLIYLYLKSSSHIKYLQKVSW